MSEATATKTQQKTMSNLEQAILRSEMESVDPTAIRLKNHVLVVATLGTATATTRHVKDATCPLSSRF